VGALLLTLVFATLFVRIPVDTDPENMLPADSPVRLLNAEMRKTFGTGEMIVVGLTDIGHGHMPGEGHRVAGWDRQDPQEGASPGDQGLLRSHRTKPTS
jgi:hypothetical protein